MYPDQSSDDQNAAGQATVTVAMDPIDAPVDLSTQDPIPVAPSNVSGPGDFPLPNDPGVVLADSPQPGVDAAIQYPWAFQLTGVYRNLNLAQIESLHLDFVHEPNIQLSIDPSGGLSIQEAVTLINWHWMPPWNSEVEVGLQGLLNTTILPKLSEQYGGQLQAEQHIVPWFSITLSATGTYTPARDGQPGQFGLTGAAGALIHFDAM